MSDHCIGWPGPCPVWGAMHGCQHPDGHPQRVRHECACGARYETSLERAQRRHRGRR